MSSRVTIKSIAQELGVSFSTVSKALNHDLSVSQQTRDIVNQKALEMGYMPNLMARGLRNQSSKSVAIILNCLDNPANTYMVRSLSVFLLKYGFATIILDSQVDLKIERKNILAALSRLPDCIIISPVSNNDPNLSLLAEIKDKVIYIDGPEDCTDVRNILIDHFYAGYISAETMFKKGHTHNLILVSDENYPSCERYMAGLQQAYKDYDNKYDERLVLHCTSSFHAGHDCFTEYYMEHPTCDTFTGVIAFCDWIAFGVYHAAMEFGISIPEQISLIGYDDTDFCLITNPPLSTIHFPKEEVAKLCCEMIISALVNTSPGVSSKEKTYTIHPYIIERQSIRTL